MLLDQGHNNRNRIIDITILLLVLGAVIYCAVYLIENREYSVKPDGSQVTITGSDISEQVEETTDPYEKNFLPICVSAKCDSWNREIALYVSDGICYAFLPAYAEMSGLTCVFDDTKYEVILSGRTIVSGEALQNLETGTDYEIEIRDQGQNNLRYTMIFLKSQNLPAVFIDTQSGSMEYVDAHKGNEESGQFSCITAEGKLDSRSAMERIKGRGNTSWDGIGAKNQYNVRLRDNTDVLHMGSAQNWIIQANRLDVSMLRNKLAYDLAKDIGIPYAVDSEFADLYFNGKYMGTYLVCEKVEVADNRVDIDNGYLLEANFREDAPEKTFATKYGTFLVNAPEEMTEGQYQYIKDYLDRTCDCISEIGTSDRYVDYIDINSFARLFIMNEISNDPDANLLSTFFYKEDDTDTAKLTAGPAWDFDLAFGNEERGENPLISAFGESWFRELYKSSIFRAEVAEVLKGFMKEYHGKYENDYFEGMKRYLNASYHMNELRWGEKEGYLASVYPEFEETTGYLEDYFATRLGSLNAVFNGSDKMHKVDLTKAGQTLHIYVEDGEVIPASVLESMEYYWSEETFTLASGQEIDPDTYKIYGDVFIRCSSGADYADNYSVEGEPGEAVTGDEKKAGRGDLAMQWVSFIMLMVPGLLSVWISGNTKIGKDNAFTILSQYFINSFIVLLSAYGIFYALYGSAVLSFSDTYSASYDYSIFNINVAFKYLLLAGGLAVAVGIVEKILIGLASRRKLTGK